MLECPHQEFIVAGPLRDPSGSMVRRCSGVHHNDRLCLNGAANFQRSIILSSRIGWVAPRHRCMRRLAIRVLVSFGRCRINWSQHDPGFYYMRRACSRAKAFPSIVPDAKTVPGRMIFGWFPGVHTSRTWSTLDMSSEGVGESLQENASSQPVPSLPLQKSVADWSKSQPE